MLLKFASVMEHSIVTGRSASPKVILDNDLYKNKKGISILVYKVRVPPLAIKYSPQHSLKPAYWRCGSVHISAAGDVQHLHLFYHFKTVHLPHLLTTSENNNIFALW